MLTYWLFWTFCVVMVTVLWSDAKHRNRMSFGSGVVDIFDMALELVEKNSACSVDVLRAALYLKAAFASEHKEALFKEYKKRMTDDYRREGREKDFRRVRVTEAFDARLAYDLLEREMDLFWLAAPQRQDDDYPLTYQYYDAPHTIKAKVMKQIDWLAKELESGRYPQHARK